MTYQLSYSGDHLCEHHMQLLERFIADAFCECRDFIPGSTLSKTMHARVTRRRIYYVPDVPSFSDSSISSQYLSLGLHPRRTRRTTSQGHTDIQGEERS